MDQYLKERLDSVEEKMESMDRSLASIDKTLAVNTAQLSEHMKRTAQVEAAIAKRDEHFESQLEVALQPIKAVRWIAGAAKSVSAIAAGITAAGSIVYMLVRAFAS
jgi:phage-related tail protein